MDKSDIKFKRALMIKNPKVSGFKPEEISSPYFGAVFGGFTDIEITILVYETGVFGIFRHAAA